MLECHKTVTYLRSTVSGKLKARVIEFSPTLAAKIVSETKKNVTFSLLACILNFKFFCYSQLVLILHT